MPAPLSDEWIEEQVRLCEKAKRGPWKTYLERKKRLYEEDEVGPWIIECGHDLPGFPHLGAFESEVDAEFVAAARVGYPLTLELLKETRTILLHVLLELDHMVSHNPECLCDEHCQEEARELLNRHEGLGAADAG